MLILEGIGGLHYSTTDDSFTFAENLPKEWSFMEFQVPVQKPNEGKVIFISVLLRQQNDFLDKKCFMKSKISYRSYNQIT